MRNTVTPFRDFYTWYFKDWFTSGARAKLSLPQRAIYLDLLGFCYTEGGISTDIEELRGRLGLGSEHDADVAEVVKQFVPLSDGERLVHPRALLEVHRLADRRARQSKGGKARGAQI